MSYFINSLPFELYILILVAALGCSIYGIFYMRKNQSGHPMIWVLPFCIFLSCVLAVNRIIQEFTNNFFMQEIVNIVTLASVGCFFISFFTTFISAYKKDYVDKEKFKKLAPMLIMCIIVMLICFIPLLLKN